MATKLAVIADDLTGALDTGVQFLNNGLRARVLIDCAALSAADADHADVIVINIDSRHLDREQACQRVRAAVEYAQSIGCSTIYKKTDSVLRGNIGGEMETVLALSGEKYLVFAPAFPRQNRFTRQGKQYIKETPIDETEFRNDPFDPIATASIREIIARQSNLPVVLIPDQSWPKDLPEGPAILVFDAETEDDLARISSLISRHGVHTIAGCAGLAAHLSLSAGISDGGRAVSFPRANLVVVSGSMMATTAAQIRKAREKGFEPIGFRQDVPDYFNTDDGLRMAQRILDGYEAGQDIIVSSANGLADRREDAPSGSLDVAQQLGQLVRQLLRRAPDLPLMIIGGDTLLASLRSIGAQYAEPILEVESGVVLNRVKSGCGVHYLVCKSGGLGGRDVLVKIRQFVREHSVRPAAAGVKSLAYTAYIAQ